MRFLASGSACALGFEGKVQSDPDSLFLFFILFYFFTDQTVKNDVHAMQCILFMFCSINKRGAKKPLKLVSFLSSRYTFLWGGDE